MSKQIQKAQQKTKGNLCKNKTIQKTAITNL